MNFEEVKELITLVNSSKLTYFEIKTADGNIKMDKSLNRTILSEENDVYDISEVKEEEKEDLKIIKSPMVGTFYSSSSPESEAFVSEGDEVSKGETLCIIEAMKLMNEIESDICGVVKEILVKDGEMVEYGQPLFKLREM